MLETFTRFTQKQNHLVVGLMSGTSVDGVDAAVCEISGIGRGNLKLRVIGSHTEELLPAIRERILAACRPGGGSPAEICDLNFIIGEEFAHAAKNAIQSAGLTTADIDLIGSHGQTIAHRPPGQIDAGMHRGSTLQIGAAAVIAERTGVPVVSNFRIRDMAAGGQGAPLVPYADWLLFSSATESRIALNIGGIANATCLPAACAPEQITAFDTGPGNMILDALAEKISGGKLACDKDGALAAAGTVSAELLREWLAHPYFQRVPPKSTGREEFGAEFAQALLQNARARGIGPNDILATATAFTARSIARSLTPIFQSAEPPEVLVAGGGARNPVLMTMLKRELPGWKFGTTEQFGIPAQFRECAAFAILARETMLGRPSNLPSATGASGPRILGEITPG